MHSVLTTVLSESYRTQEGEIQGRVYEDSQGLKRLSCMKMLGELNRLE